MLRVIKSGRTGACASTNSSTVALRKRMYRASEPRVSGVTPESTNKEIVLLNQLLLSLGDIMFLTFPTLNYDQI